MSTARTVIFETTRLIIRVATLDDVEMYYALWTSGQVMVNVGFPQGIRTTRDEIGQRIKMQIPSPYDSLLVAELKATAQAIGECAMHPPNEEGIAETDVKLLPEFWRHKYGVETKQGLVDYLFTHTDCKAVQATPNVGNIASIKMQEAVGGVRVGEGVYEFPESMRAFTTPVHHYIYHVRREDWQKLHT